MGESYYPFDEGTGANVTEAQWYKMGRLFAADGVALAYGSLLPFGDSTGMQVKVPVGVAWVNGHYYESDAQRTLAIDASHATQHRYDRVVVRVDRTANTVTTAVLKGTNAASQSAALLVAPTVTQSAATWELSLALVYIAPTVTTITIANVTDERPISSGIDGASGSMVKLAYQSLSANGVLSFSSIPQTFKSLHLKVWTRSSFAAASAACRYRFNSDSGANYNWQRQFASNTTPSADRFNTGNTDGDFGSQPGASATAGQFGNYVVDVFDYASSGSPKALVSSGGYISGTTPIVMQVYGYWGNTAAISSILLGDDHSLTTGLASGSYATLYGVR